jgi:hypothetical protein
MAPAAPCRSGHPCPFTHESSSTATTTRTATTALGGDADPSLGACIPPLPLSLSLHPCPPSTSRPSGEVLERRGGPLIILPKGAPREYGRPVERRTRDPTMMSYDLGPPSLALAKFRLRRQ